MDELVEYPVKVLQKIGTDKTVVSLLTDNPDIDMQSEEADEVFNKYLFNYGYVDNTTSETAAYICVESDLSRFISPAMQEMKIYVTIICHKQFMNIDTSKFQGMVGNRRDNSGVIMRFDYFDMLSGEPVLLEGVGHIRSPKIKELYPSNGIGYKTYNMYLAFLSMKNEDFTDKFKGLLNHHNENTKYDKLNKYDMMAANKIMRGIYNEILSFFIAETISWDAGSGRFNVYKDTHKTNIGEINSKNFDAVCKTILNLILSV